ncbi:uncharacterized protein [Nicotiana tomentosiformis]|uniref:uncharacterized protein n=1 Tax=Nicotiana tomentosiformis TaxID=4098 RepID=UPI00388CA741
MVRTRATVTDDDAPRAGVSRGRGTSRGRGRGGACTTVRAPIRAAVEEPPVAAIKERAPEVVVRAIASEEEQFGLARFKKYHPPTFSGLSLEDSHGFLEECNRILCTMGIVEMSGVAFTTFQLKEAAYRWWRAYELGSLVEAASLSWTRFSEMFLREFVPQTLQDAWRAVFEQLRQGIMSVSEYAFRFNDLSRHAPALVSTV